MKCTSPTPSYQSVGGHKTFPASNVLWFKTLQKTRWSWVLFPSVNGKCKFKWALKKKLNVHKWGTKNHADHDMAWCDANTKWQVVMRKSQLPTLEYVQKKKCHKCPELCQWVEPKGLGRRGYRCRQFPLLCFLASYFHATNCLKILHVHEDNQCRFCPRKTGSKNAVIANAHLNWRKQKKVSHL